MSYVGDPFRHDVFISYTHADADGDGESLHKTWSRSFAEALKDEMRAMPGMGTSFRLFIDQDHRPGQGVDPMAPLSDQLQQEIAGSAIMAVLVSPHYLQSKWCLQEREWWRDEQTRLKIPFDERMAIARIWPLMPAEDKWPDMFVDGRGEQLVGFWFYDRAKDPLVEPQPFAWPEVRKNEPNPFRAALLQMVGSLRLKLKDLKEKLDERARQRSEADKLAATGQVVYLHARADQKEDWEKARDALQNAGFAVMPGEPDPLESDPVKQEELKRNRIQLLSACDALLLLGSADSRALDADLLIIGRQDRHSARAASKKLLPCAVLGRPGTAATDQRKLNARALQVEWIDATGDGWQTSVQGWLREKGAALGGAS